MPSGTSYVGDGWANRVHVYDPAGAYLTSFAVGWGARTGQTERVQGLAVGPDGAVYVADSWDNHRITVFAPGVPGWKQVNINGFGDRWRHGSPACCRSREPVCGRLWGTDLAHDGGRGLESGQR